MRGPTNNLIGLESISEINEECNDELLAAFSLQYIRRQLCLLVNPGQSISGDSRSLNPFIYFFERITFSRVRRLVLSSLSPFLYPFSRTLDLEIYSQNCSKIFMSKRIFPNYKYEIQIRC